MLKVSVYRVALFLCVMGVSLPVMAQELPTLEKGQALVMLSASDQIEAEQDMLQASLRIEIEDKDARVVQDKINKAMSAAVALSKKEPSVEVSTGQYYVYSYEKPQPKISIGSEDKPPVWKGNQTLILKSKDSKAVLDLVAKVQDMAFVMDGLSYLLSPEKTESYKDELLVGALKKIQDKAALVAKTLGKSGYELVDINVDSSYMPSPMPMVRGMAKMEMMSADIATMSAPVAEPGKSNVRVSVSARVILQP